MDAKHAGYEAFWNGASLSENPFSNEQAMEWLAWLDGWMIAHAEYEQAFVEYA